jgi:hypothetical protein
VIPMLLHVSQADIRQSATRAGGASMLIVRRLIRGCYRIGEIDQSPVQGFSICQTFGGDSALME